MNNINRAADTEGKTHNRGSERKDSDAPPILTSWSRLYAVVLTELAVLIFLFYFFSRYYQ